MRSVRFEEAALETYPTRQAWDAAAGDIVATMLDRWHLVAGEPFTGGESGAALRVTTAHGRPAVLKVGFPHWEGHWEAVALESWGTDFAPEVLRQDAWTWAMLLECADPGGPLSRFETSTEHALEIAAGLFTAAVTGRPTLGLPPGIPSLGEVVGRYVADATAALPLQHRALEPWGGAHVLEPFLGDALELIDGGRSTVLLHGDLNPGNILQHGQRWILIDPKPMLGEPEFDLFPLVEQLGSPLAQSAPSQVLEGHLELVSAMVDCDPARVARWCAVRAALNVSWLLNDGNQPAAQAAMRELVVWRAVSGT